MTSNEPSGISAFLKNRLLFRAPVTQNPRNFSKTKKAFILFCIGTGCVLPGYTSTVYLPALPEITKDFNAPTIAVTLSTSLFILFQGIGPLFWASLSEHFEVRRPFYMFSNILFFAASIWCCFVENIWVLVFLRCVQAAGSSAFLSVGAGTVTDLWREDKRGQAMGMIFFGQFLGSLLGPVIGGILTRELSWRANFWSCVIMSGLLTAMTFLFVTETYFVDAEPFIVFDPNKRRRRGVVGTILLVGAHVDEIATTDLVKPGRRQTIVLGSQRNNWNEKTAADEAIPSTPSLPGPSTSSSSSPSSSSSSASPSPATGGAVEMEDVGDKNKLVSSEDAILPASSPEVQVKAKEKEREEEISTPTPPAPSSSTTTKTTTPYKKPMYFPFRPLSNLRYSFMILLAIAGGVAYGSMYTMQIIIPTYFAGYYGLNSFEIGLTYLGGGFGNILSSVVGGKYLDSKSAKKRGGQTMPEDRITINALFSLIVTIPVGTAVFGWSLERGWSLAVPIVGFSLVSFGMSQVLLSCSSYLVDAIPKKSASAVACFNFVRMTMACILSLISDPLRSIGPEWIGMILTFLNIAAFFFFFPVKIKGRKMRLRAHVGFDNNGNAI